MGAGVANAPAAGVPATGAGDDGLRVPGQQVRTIAGGASTAAVPATGFLGVPTLNIDQAAKAVPERHPTSGRVSDTPGQRLQHESANKGLTMAAKQERARSFASARLAVTLEAQRAGPSATSSSASTTSLGAPLEVWFVGLSGYQYKC